MIKLTDLISENEKVDYPLVQKNGYSVRGSPDWKKFKLNGIYHDGDVLNYIHSQHGDFQEDDRVTGDYQLQAVDPDTIPDSEWSMSDNWVKQLAQSKEQFPPIVVDGHKSIIDGGHRLAAAKSRGDKKILVFKPINSVEESLTEGPDGIHFDDIDIDIWDSSEYTDMFFCLSKIGGKHIYFCYINSDAKVISNDERYNSIFRHNPPDDVMSTHGDLMRYIYEVSKLHLYSKKSGRGDEDLDVESIRLIHGRVFFVRGTYIMSCWEPLSTLQSYKSDIVSMLKDCGIDAMITLYETSDHRGTFLPYNEAFGESASEKPATSRDSENERLKQLHLNADLKRKMIKLPPNELQVAADKLKIPVIKLKDLLGKNVAESDVPGKRKYGGVKGDHESILDLRKQYEKNRKRDFPEPWRGPHQGVELTLMLKGEKPAAIVDPTLEALNEFLPYIKSGKFISKTIPEKNGGGLVVSLPEESWRIDKILKILPTPRSQTRDAKLGRLLGYHKEDIRSFLDLTYESMFPKEFDRHTLGSCMVAAQMAMNYLLSKGRKDFKVVEGWVSLHPDQEEHDWSAHTWIEFSNGRIFDPTKKQWAEWGFDPNESEYLKIKKKYTPEEYSQLCQKHPDDRWEKFKKV